MTERTHTEQRAMILSWQDFHNLVAVGHASSDDKQRPTLRNLNVSVTAEGTLQVEATDSYLLVRRTFNPVSVDGLAEWLEDTPQQIVAADLFAAEKFFEARIKDEGWTVVRSDVYVEWWVTYPTRTVATLELRHQGSRWAVVAVRCDTRTIKFPDIQKLIDDFPARPKPSEVTINPAILQQLVRSSGVRWSRSKVGDQGGFKFETAGPMKPFRVTLHKEPTWMAMQMPVRPPS